MFNRMYRNVLAIAALIGLGATREIHMGAPVMPHAPDLPKAPTRPRAERQKPRRRRVRGSSSFKPNGAQECARRVRQIAAGTLTVANGLWYGDPTKTYASR
jgi:hypothetical protein